MSYVPDGNPGERRYGKWAGNPEGKLEDTARCIISLRPDATFIYCQCARKRGHGFNGNFCKQHAKRYPAVAPSPIGTGGPKKTDEPPNPSTNTVVHKSSS